MTAAPKGPPKQSLAGGAKYHAIKVTQKWAEFRKAVQSTATHTEAERAARDAQRQREARTDEKDHTSP